MLFLLGQHLPALLEKTERAFFLAQVYPALVLLSLESNLPQLQVRRWLGWVGGGEWGVWTHRIECQQPGAPPTINQTNPAQDQALKHVAAEAVWRALGNQVRGLVEVVGGG